MVQSGTLSVPRISQRSFLASPLGENMFGTTISTTEQSAERSIVTSFVPVHPLACCTATAYKPGSVMSTVGDIPMLVLPENHSTEVKIPGSDNVTVLPGQMSGSVAVISGFSEVKTLTAFEMVAV